MGLTIHYSLKSEVGSPERARQMIQQLRQAALDLPMAEVGEGNCKLSGTDCDSHAATDIFHRCILIQAQRMMGIAGTCHFVVPKHVIAFYAVPGDGCDVANFGLANYPTAVETKNGPGETGLHGRSWQAWCKTQYSSNPKAGGVVILSAAIWR